MSSAPSDPPPGHTDPSAFLPDPPDPLPERSAPDRPGPLPGAPADARHAASLLQALGLTPAQAQVLDAVSRDGDTTAAALAASTGLRRPQVSEALQVLEELGLISRNHRERPQPVSLGTGVGPALNGLLEHLDRQRDQERDREADRAQRAGALLRQRAEDLGHRPRAYLRRLTGAGPGADWDLLRPRRSYDEVARPQGNTVHFGSHLKPSPARRRLLVVGAVPEYRRAVLLSRGVELRSTDTALPMLVVVDGTRGRVEIGTIASGSTAWTFDPAQVAALQSLFETWWDAADGR